MKQYTEIDLPKKIKNFLAFLFLISGIVLTYLSLQELEKLQLYFFIFSTLSTLNILIVILNKTSFFNKFFSLYIWLGYFFSYTSHIIFFNENYNFPTGNFDFEDFNNRKELYIVLIIFNLSILISFLISNKYLYLRHKFSNIKLNKFYSKNTNLFLLSIISIILLISFSNIIYKFFDYYFFYKAKNPPILDAFFKWLYLFGFSSLMCIFLNLNQSKKIIIQLLIIYFVQEFLFYYSILSRGCIFNSLAIFAAFVIKYQFDKNYNYKIILSFFVLIFSLFVINFYILIDERGGSNKENFENYRSKLNLNIKYNIKKHSNSSLVNKINYYQPILNKTENKTKLTSDFVPKVKRLFFSIKNRVFGVDSLMVVIGYPNKGFDFLKESLNEKFDPGNTSIFDKIRYKNTISNQTRNITMPGILAFLYFSGSLSFVFIMTFLLILFCNLIEKINMLINNNIFLTSLISQLLAYRLWHFGYAPSNSYKILIAIFFSIILVYVTQRILLNFKIFNK